MGADIPCRFRPAQRLPWSLPHYGSHLLHPLPNYAFQLDRGGLRSTFPIPPNLSQLTSSPEEFPFEYFWIAEEKDVPGLCQRRFSRPATGISLRRGLPITGIAALLNLSGGTCFFNRCNPSRNSVLHGGLLYSRS